MPSKLTSFMFLQLLVGPARLVEVLGALARRPTPRAARPPPHRAGQPWSAPLSVRPLTVVIGGSRQRVRLRPLGATASGSSRTGHVAARAAPATCPTSPPAPRPRSTPRSPAGVLAPMSRPAGPWTRSRSVMPAVGEPVGPGLLGPARARARRCSRPRPASAAASAGPARSSSWLITTTLSRPARRGDRRRSRCATSVIDLGVPAEQVRPQRAGHRRSAPAPTITSFGTGHSTVITWSGATSVLAHPPAEQPRRVLARLGDRLRR